MLISQAASMGSIPIHHEFGGSVMVAQPPLNAFYDHLLSHGTLAQLAEQSAHNAQVIGSNPVCPTKKPKSNGYHGLNVRYQLASHRPRD